MEQKKPLLIQNGKIFTMNPEQPRIDNLLAIQGTICGVNLSDSEINAVEDLEVLNLEGKICLPGFHDTHMHLLGLGVNRYRWIDLNGANSIDELIDIIRNTIIRRKIPKNSWVIGYGWDQENYLEKRMPTKYDLDLISKDHYIYVKRICSHIGVCNSKLLNMCNIADSAYYNNADIIRHPDGKPTGILADQALGLVNAYIPVPRQPDLESIILKTCDYLSSLGLTTVETDDLSLWPDFDFNKRVLDTYINMRSYGTLKIRILEQVRVKTLEDLHRILPVIKRIKQDEWFSISGIKLMLDGSLGGMTAALRQPYLYTKTLRGTLLYKDSELLEIAQICRENDLGIICHAIGDRAIDQFIRVISGVYDAEDQPRPRLVHCQLCHQTQLAKLADMTATVLIQPLFATSDRDMVPSRIDWWEQEPVYGWKSMLNHGLLIAGGSDAPVEDASPLLGMDAAVTRCSQHSMSLEAWKPEECLDLTEAVSLYTRWAAKSVNRNEHFGMLRQGNAADMVILGSDISSPEQRLRDVQAEMTICGGTIMTQDLYF